MRKRLALLGVLLLLAAALIYVYPSIASPISSGLGQNAISVVLDSTNVISIAPQGSNFYAANMSGGDTLAVSLTTNPGNVDVLLMNRGNFSLWSEGSKGSY